MDLDPFCVLYCNGWGLQQSRHTCSDSLSEGKRSRVLQGTVHACDAYQGYSTKGTAKSLTASRVLGRRVYSCLHPSPHSPTPWAFLYSPALCSNASKLPDKPSHKVRHPYALYYGAPTPASFPLPCPISNSSPFHPARTHLSPRPSPPPHNNAPAYPQLPRLQQRCPTAEEWFAYRPIPWGDSVQPRPQHVAHQGSRL